MAIRTITPDPLSTFMSQEFLRSSHFMLFMPIFKPFIDQKQSRNISLFCESVEFPGMNSVSTDYRIAGLNRQKITYGKEYPDVTFTFIHNTETPIYQMLTDWMTYIGGGVARAGTNVPYYDEYTCDMHLYQLYDVPKDQVKRFGGLSNILSAIDKFNAKFLNSDKLFNISEIGQEFVGRFTDVTVFSQPRGKYYDVRFYGGYPTAIAPMQSSWAEENFQRLSVTFSYEYFAINERTR